MYKKFIFNYKKINNKYLITNNLGKYWFLKEREFNKLNNEQELPKGLIKDLENRQFVYYEEHNTFTHGFYKQLRENKWYLKASTVLHIFVVSKNCNYNCVYCQAGKLNQKEKYLMDKDTAQKAVDIAFESPSPVLDFEFQGGEPLINFEIIKYIVEYSKQKNKTLTEDAKKDISFNIVSNLSLLSDEMISFIKNNCIAICTSIDGSRELQNTNRPYINNDSYDATNKNVMKLKENNINVSALVTTTKYSLDKYKEIVDEYIGLGLKSVAIRPLTKLGKAVSNWEQIGYTAEEFLEFYKNALDYIIKVNKRGYLLKEYISSIFLSKIINNEDLNYMELRSPCGATIGQLAYYYDGDIYSCDEGRMLAEMGDKKFLLGNVFNNCYKDLIKCECTKEVCKASTLEISTICGSCVYMPYCGICPVLNYSNYGKMDLQDKDDFKCKINKGILDYLFSIIDKDKKVLKIFQSWL